MFGYSIDTKALSEYQVRVLRAAKKLEDFERKFLNTLANMTMQKVMPRTPVDTGTLRRSWKVSKVVKKGNTLEIVIYNDAKQNGMDESYASRNRASWVEGRWMLTTSTDEVKAEMIRVWNMLFDEFVKEAGL